MILGDDQNYNERSLLGTVIITKEGEPVLIDSVGRKYCVVTYIKSGEKDKISTSSLDLNHPMLIGNVNKSGRVLYAYRKASRQYRAGLSQNNLMIVDSFRSRERVNYASKAVANTLIGNFPPFEESYEAINKGFAKQVAVSRQVSLCSPEDISNSKDILLYWENHQVGNLKGNEGFLLLKQYEFLSEAIGDVLNENH